MSLWLLCCLLLFVGARGYDWISHQSWFLAPELSLPWVILGGIGLAIASNRPALTASTKPESHLPLTPRSPAAIKTPATPVARPRSSTKSASISFEIETK